MQLKAVLAPMLIAAVGIVLSIIGIFLVRTREGASMRELLRSLGVGVNFSSLLIARRDVRYPLPAGNPELARAVVLGHHGARRRYHHRTGYRILHFALL